MGKASRRKRQAPEQEPDLLAVLAAGTCTHCRKRPRSTPALWCATCRREAIATSLNTNPDTVVVFGPTGVVKGDPGLLNPDHLQDLLDLLEQHDHPDTGA